MTFSLDIFFDDGDPATVKTAGMGGVQPASPINKLTSRRVKEVAVHLKSFKAGTDLAQLARNCWAAPLSREGREQPGGCRGTSASGTARPKADTAAVKGEFTLVVRPSSK
jgi:hypothetical protein